MAFELTSHRKSNNARPAWSGAAFIVEAMLLLVFLIASIAVFTQAFALAAEKSAEADELSRAVAAASNVAERFAADPQSVTSSSTEGDLVVLCDVTSEGRDGGTLYEATIEVYEANSANEASADGAEPLYSITTARYESEVA